MAQIEFALDEHEGRVSALEPLRGRSGWLRVSRLSLEALDRPEDHVIVAAAFDDTGPLDEEAACRLLTLPGRIVGGLLPDAPESILSSTTEARRERIERRVSQRCAADFDTEAHKLDAWADDLKVSLEREIKDLDREIKDARRAATAAPSLEEKLAGQRRVKSLETQRNEKRRTLFEEQDRIEERRSTLIAAIEAKLAVKAELRTLFTIRCTLAPHTDTTREGAHAIR